MNARELPDLFEILDIAVIETGLRDPRIRRANAAACAILGRPERDVVGLPWDDLAVQEDLEWWRIEARRRPEIGQPRKRMMVRLLRPDSTVVHVLATVVLLTDSEGDPYLLTHIQDVSEEIAARDRLRLVIENTPVSMFLLDRDGRVLVSEGNASPEAAVRLREARQSSALSTFSDLPRFTSALRRALTGESVHEDIDMFGHSLDVHLVPAPGANGQVAAVAADVTDLQCALADLRSRSSEQAAVADLGQRALEARDPGPLWAQAATILVDHLPVDLVEIHELGGAGDRIRRLARRRRGDESRGGLNGSDEPGSDQDRMEPNRPVVPLAVPIGHPDQPLAAIEIYRWSDTVPLTQQKRQFIDSIAALLGSAALRFQMENEIRHRSLHDSLTGLPNRVALLEALSQALQRAGRDDGQVGVLFIDLDGFKAVNDTLGHQAGDDLLRTTATRLSRAVRPGDIVGRLAGDEFAVLFENVRGTADLERVANRILASLAAPNQLLDHLVVLTGSAGLALSSQDLRDGEALLNAADIAMYNAKRAGPGRYLVYDTSMRARLHEQITYVDGLQHTFDSN
ncbi:sensor domain-containing diguanylate cyclase [Frankia sp. CcI49]|uniref:sensor domain-containing protein n=1 Tax=Frankia sp. CcI49 TaxID=1745382 RepID=UPI001F52494D|nr:sensor domain-containing diguanylate cyclase [Frankia sp. CcI49]